MPLHADNVRRDATTGAAASLHASAISSGAILTLAATLLGMSVALDRFVPIGIGPLTLTFVLGVAYGTMGYWIGVTEFALRRFLAWVVPFFVVAVASVLVADRFGTLTDSAGGLVWLLLVPGIATMTLDERRFRALLRGLVIGACALLAVVVWRFVRGARVLDEGYFQLLGLNRNAVDMTIVWLIPPVLWAPTLRVPRVGRLLFVGASVLWLVSSQGRTGFIGLLMVPFVYALLKPATPFSRATRLGMVAVLGALVYAALTTVSIPGLPATERLVQYQSADRTEADQVRLLLNEKSLSLARKHPVTGVGWGLYEGQYDEAADKAHSPRVRERVLQAPAHNTYYDVLASTGFPGFFFYIGALLVPVLLGVRHARDPDVRALTAGFVIVLFGMAFHVSHGSMIGLAIALVLASIARASRPAPDPVA